MNRLWRVTLSVPQGHLTAHTSYAVLAETEQEATAKAIAYAYPDLTQPVDSVEAEVDEDGVLKGTTHFTRRVTR